MIRLHKVSFAYQGNPQKGSLHQIDLTVREGECVLLCGRSGCGKTSFIRLINGLIPAFYPGELSGTVSIDEKSVSQTPMYQLSELVGSVFQNPRSQFFNVDTDSEIAFGMENLSWPKEKMKSRLLETVHDLQIEKLTGRMIFELSGGEKQKVAFASIYAMNPDIYLLDEPSSNLDMEAIEELRKILHLLKKQGKTILIAEHRIYYLQGIADRIVYIQDGKIYKSFTPVQFNDLSEAERHAMGLRAADLSQVRIPQIKQSSAEPILEIRDLSLFYRKRCVVKGINLCAAPGEIIGIIGHNGAGKSTFSRALCGLHKETEGTFLFNGKILNAKERLNHSYMVMQEVGYQLFADTVQKECGFGIRNPDPEIAEDAMRQLGIWDHRDSHPNTLSGGQKQRVAVAVAMVCQRDLLIFDEPTSGLDYDSMIQVSRLFQTLSALGKIIFVVTHDYEFLTSACSRIFHLDDGGMLGDYSMSPNHKDKLHDFFMHPTTPFWSDAI